MKRVLLTGATGFIGRHCIQPLLKAGFDVCALTSQPIPEISSEVSLRRVDLLDAAAVEEALLDFEPTHLLHLAWKRMAGGAWAKADEAEQRPWIDASIRLVRRFSEAGGRRAVVTGTCAEYDWSHGICTEEKTPIKPASAYGVGKHAVHEAAEECARQTGLSLGWARLFFMYGPHEDPSRLVSHVVKSLLAGERARCSHGLQRRDYLYVADVAEALVGLLDSAAPGTFNIGSGQAVRLQDLVMEIATQIGRPELVEFGALPAGPVDAPLVVADTRRLAATLGWSPRFNFSTGIRETIDWWELNRFARTAA